MYGLNVPDGRSSDRLRRSIRGSFVVPNFLMTGADFGVTDEQHSAIWRIIYVAAVCLKMAVTRTRVWIKISSYRRCETQFSIFEKRSTRIKVCEGRRVSINLFNNTRPGKYVLGLTSREKRDNGRFLCALNYMFLRELRIYTRLSLKM